MKTAHPVAEASEGTIVRLFGPPRIERDGQVSSVDTRKAFALFAYLAVTGRAQSRDHLAALLWPEANQTRARSALRRTLSALNAALGGRGLRIERESLALLQDQAWVDVLRFRDLCGRSDGGDLAALAEAAELYGGEFLSGFGLRDSPEFDDWQLAVANELRRALGGVLERLAESLARIDPDTAIGYARRWVTLDVLHEPAHQSLMRLYASRGDRTAALRQYRECVAALDSDLGVEPLDTTTELYDSIREDRTAAPSDRKPVRAASPELPMVGRDHEMQQLLDAHAAVATDGHLVVIGGEPGIGKTRLAREFLSTVADRNELVLEAHCHPEEVLLGFGAIVELLRAIPAERLASVPPEALVEASRLVRELAPDAAAPPSIDSPAARRRLLEGVADVIVFSGVSVLFADDVQWMDESSRDALRFVARRLRGRPLMVLITWRTEEVPPAHPLRRMLADATRAGLATGITLQRLTEDDVNEILEGRSDRPAGLFAETAGVPFFISEYLKSEVQGTAFPTLPTGVRDLLASRVASVSEAAGQVLTAAAIIGRAFDPPTVREASGRSDEEVAAALDELTAHALVAESAELYDFTHPKLREYVYEHTTLGRRRLLHARVARAAGRASRRRPELAAVAAQHLERAGQAEAAAEQFRLAGDHARGIYANAEALSLYRSALALGSENAAQLHELIADLLTLEGRYGEATGAYEKAMALGGDVAVLGRKLGDVRHRLGEWDSAEAHYLEAEAATSARSDRARILADRSLNAHRAGRAELARSLAVQASAAATSADDPLAIVQAHNIEGIIASHRGEVAPARAHFESSLALAEKIGDPAATAAALNNLALALRVEGNAELALAQAERALELCCRIGDRHREAAVHSNIADALRDLGRDDEAMEHLKTSAALFSDIGEHDRPHPAIWKLVEW